MEITLDRNLFMQIGLDSGALTMLGTVVHSLREAGEYRGIVRWSANPEAPFYISADKNSPVAQVNIDLATLANPSAGSQACCGVAEKNRFVVNPKGYVLFHVSGGEGGYSVHVRKAEEAANTKIYDTRELQEGDVFTATFLRPGTYSVSNLVTKSKGEITVSYPERGNTAYRPPSPHVVECTAHGIESNRVELKPGQALNFHIKTPSRIKIELIRPDDGSGQPREASVRGRKTTRRSDS